MNSTYPRPPRQHLTAESIARGLQKSRRAGSGWIACCPAHEDRTPSLAIDTGTDGRVLLRCHSKTAGCTTADICAAMGVEVADLFPVASSFLPPVPKKSSLPSYGYATSDAAIASYIKKLGEPIAQYSYESYAGDLLGFVLRFSKPDGGKDIRPVAFDVDGFWRCKQMASPRVLYNLLTVRELDDQIVYVVEGEKCVDAMQSIELVATTSAAGSNAAHFTNWQPLAGREVVIIPDNDKAGAGYADAVASILAGLNPRPSVKRMSLPVGPGEDVADYIAKNGL